MAQTRSNQEGWILQFLSTPRIYLSPTCLRVFRRRMLQFSRSGVGSKYRLIYQVGAERSTTIISKCLGHSIVDLEDSGYSSSCSDACITAIGDGILASKFGRIHTAISPLVWFVTSRTTERDRSSNRGALLTPACRGIHGA